MDRVGNGLECNSLVLYGITAVFDLLVYISVSGLPLEIPSSVAMFSAVPGTQGTDVYTMV